MLREEPSPLGTDRPQKGCSARLRAGTRTVTEAARHLHGDLQTSPSEGEPLSAAAPGSGIPGGERPPQPGLITGQQFPPGHMEAAGPGVQPFWPHLPGRLPCR